MFFGFLWLFQLEQQICYWQLGETSMCWLLAHVRYNPGTQRERERERETKCLCKSHVLHTRSCLEESNTAGGSRGRCGDGGSRATSGQWHMLCHCPFNLVSQKDTGIKEHKHGFRAKPALKWSKANELSIYSCYKWTLAISGQVWYIYIYTYSV